MKPFSLRLRSYLKANNISQYRFAKMISQESKRDFKNTLRKVQRWAKEHEPRLTTFEGAHALKIIQNWERSNGLRRDKLRRDSRNQSEEERNEMLNLKGQGIKSLSYFERHKILDTFCNSGFSFSSILNPLQIKIIHLYFGLNKSQKSLNNTAIGRKFQISPAVVRGNLISGLRRMKYPHLPVGKSFQSESFQKGKKILDTFFKHGLFLSALLNKKQETFIRLRYGLDGRKPITLQAIGKRYGVTRESVRKTILRSLQKLI